MPTWFVSKPAWATSNTPRSSAPAGCHFPDIDAWHLWPQAKSELANVNIALVDASFFSADELGGRATVAHPLVTETLALFTRLPTRLILTHINHTNPILDIGSPANRIVNVAGAEEEILFMASSFTDNVIGEALLRRADACVYGVRRV